MANKNMVRGSLLAAAATLIFAAAPAQAGVRVRLGFAAQIVAPPVFVSVGAPAYVPYYAPYPGRCYANGYYAPCAVPYAAVAPVVVAPTVSFVRVFVPGPRPHFIVRRVVRPGFHRRW